MVLDEKNGFVRSAFRCRVRDGSVILLRAREKKIKANSPARKGNAQKKARIITCGLFDSVSSYKLNAAFTWSAKSSFSQVNSSTVTVLWSPLGE